MASRHDVRGDPPELGIARRLPRRARLKRRRLIRPLFDRNAPDIQSVAHGTIRCVYRLVSREETGVPVQVGFVASKRIRRAVDRNRIKRVMRAAFQDRMAVVEKAVPDACSLTMMMIFRADSVPEGRRLTRDVQRTSEVIAVKAAEQRTWSPGPVPLAGATDVGAAPTES